MDAVVCLTDGEKTRATMKIRVTTFTLSGDLNVRVLRDIQTPNSIIRFTILERAIVLPFRV
jgi:hypothetical protein